MYGPRLPVSLTAWRWISTLYVLAQHFLYALVLTCPSLTLKHGVTEILMETLSITSTSQVYRPSGNTKRMSRISRASWQGTVQLSWACKTEMKLALQGGNMLQWTRSTEQHTAVEIWNHLSLCSGSIPALPLHTKNKWRQWNLETSVILGSVSVSCRLHSPALGTWYLSRKCP